MFALDHTGKFAKWLLSIALVSSAFAYTGHATRAPHNSTPVTELKITSGESEKKITFYYSLQSLPSENRINRQQVTASLFSYARWIKTCANISAQKINSFKKSFLTLIRPHVARYATGAITFYSRG
jgi:hypothetical protein